MLLCSRGVARRMSSQRPRFGLGAEGPPDLQSAQTSLASSCLFFFFPFLPTALLSYPSSLFYLLTLNLYSLPSSIARISFLGAHWSVRYRGKTCLPQKAFNAIVLLTLATHLLSWMGLFLDRHHHSISFSFLQDLSSDSAGSASFTKISPRISQSTIAEWFGSFGLHFSS